VPYASESPPEDQFDLPVLLKSALWGFLDGRRVLATRHHVVPVNHAPVTPAIVLARTPDALAETLLDRIREKLSVYLGPLEGGADGYGWPFGRDIYVSELVEILESVPGVDYVIDLGLTSACAAAEAGCVKASQLWHEEGDQIGLALEEHHLPKLAFDTAQILILPHASFLPVRIAVEATVTGADDPATVKRLAKSAIRRAVHPLLDGPATDTTAVTLYEVSKLDDALRNAGVTGHSTVDVAPDRRVFTGSVLTAFRVYGGEILNWQTTVALVPPVSVPPTNP